MFILINTLIAGKNDETSIPPEQAYYSELNKEGVSDEDCRHI